MKGGRRVAVLGGGAAGLMAAVMAARHGAAVTILETNDRVGKKLLKTGNGRCNLTNTRLSAAGYNRPGFVAPTLAQYSCAGLRALFEGLGLWTVADAEGRVYPYSDAASSVLDVLRLAAAAGGAAERCSATVKTLAPQSGSFLIRLADGTALWADAVVVATGGGTALLEPLGHRTVLRAPALCPIRTETAQLRGLSGLRAHCRATLREGERELAFETGELLFRDYGVSGVLIFELSRRAEAGQTLSLDLAPEFSHGELLARLQKHAALGIAASEPLIGILRRRIAQAVVRYAGSTAPEALCRALKDFRLPVLGLAETEQAQVTRGGADVGQLDAATLESRLYPGLYAAGETLDIDGRCGGYNLHWAFASGAIAGANAAAGV